MLTPHNIIHCNACFAYFNKIWGNPISTCNSTLAPKFMFVFEWPWRAVAIRGLAICLTAGIMLV
jgi:hypothetical protein